MYRDGASESRGLLIYRQVKVLVQTSDDQLFFLKVNSDDVHRKFEDCCQIDDNAKGGDLTFM